MTTLKPQKTKIEETVVGAYQNIENTVVSTYQKIEDTVVGTYQKIEDTVVGTYQKIEDQFVERFLDVNEYSIVNYLIQDYLYFRHPFMKTDMSDGRCMELVSGHLVAEIVGRSGILS